MARWVHIKVKGREKCMVDAERLVAVRQHGETANIQVILEGGIVLDVSERDSKEAIGYLISPEMANKFLSQ